MQPIQSHLKYEGVILGAREGNRTIILLYKYMIKLLYKFKDALPSGQGSNSSARPSLLYGSDPTAMALPTLLFSQTNPLAADQT